MAILTLFTTKASAETEISLLTCQPHAEVYSLYGHTAIRVQEPSRNLDVAINWGVFDPSQSNFILRFIFGLTDYSMGIYDIKMFLKEYEYYGSAVYQQRLNLTEDEKQAILQALDENDKPGNRVYRYNFFYDNCTSRARDVILNAINGKVEFQQTSMQKGEKSFRQLIHWKNMGYNWCAEGNDLLLGVKADMNTTREEREFLPEILSADFDSATITRPDGQKVALVDSAFWLVQAGTPHFQPMDDFPLPPILCSILIVIVVAVWTLMEKYQLKRRIKGGDVLFFYLFGLMGLLLFAMIFSQHPTVQVNLQILVFNPLWLILISPWTKWKYRFHVALACIALFYIGNILQDYAEGMNILAFSLLLRTMYRMKNKE